MGSTSMHNLYPWDFVGEVWFQLEIGERKYSQNKDFKLRFCLSLTFDPYKWMKVIAHFLKGQFKSTWARGRNIKYERKC